jgi:hypothetical protein
MTATPLHLAQLNLGRMLAPLDSPLMADFVNALADINALAERSPGFVWRLVGDGGNDATSIRPYPDERIIVNMSVWETVAALKAYAYKSEHAQFLRRRHEWFEKFDGPYLVLWWIPEGHTPTVWEAKDRLDHLRAHGETPHAFTFKRIFAPESIIS